MLQVLGGPGWPPFDTLDCELLIEGGHFVGPSYSLPPSQTCRRRLQSSSALFKSQSVDLYCPGPLTSAQGLRRGPRGPLDQSSM